MTILYAMIFAVVAGNHDPLGHATYNIPFDSVATCREFVESGAIDEDVMNLLKSLKQDYPGQDIGVELQCVPEGRGA